MGKGTGSVSVIGGADEPTSIFIAGKGGKVKLTTRIRNYFGKAKMNRIKKRITANPHTPEEEDAEAFRAFWEQIQERERKATEIADDISPMDFHIYEIVCPGNGMRIELSEERKIKHREKKMAVAVLYEAKVKDDEIIRILQKFCDIEYNEAMNLLLNEKIVEAPCRKLKQFLILEKRFDPDDADIFIRKHVIRKLTRDIELCKLPSEKLYNADLASRIAGMKTTLNGS